MAAPSPEGGGFPLRVLIAEDSDDDLQLLLRELRRGGYAPDHHVVQSKLALAEALASRADWQIVVSDFSMPAMTGFDVVETVKAVDPDLPCIVVSGTITEDAAVDVLRAGARDFVVKDRLARLVPAIRREVQEARERARRRDAEESLRETRGRMQFVLDSVGIGTWSVDLRSDMVRWSDVMERLHGLAPGTFLMTRDAWRALVHAEDRARIEASIPSLLDEHDDWRVEYRTTWADGSEHWILSIGRVAFGPHRQPRQAVGVSMDVTEQRDLEQRMQQAQKMESIGNLAGGIAHDFNNLLTVISGFAELAADRTTDPGVLEPLREIGTAAASATALTRQLLTFSRRQIVRPVLLDLSGHIRGFGRILRRMVEEHVHLEFRLAAGLPRVRADPGQMEQVLLNLVANARDAMQRGGMVTIETEQDTVHDSLPGPRSDLPPGRYIVLSVADTGTGMPPDVRARVFDPFFTTKPPGQGTGLGLATVYGIVTQGGGQIRLQSEVGSGSRFRIYLPVAAPSEVTAEALPLETPQDLSGTETILVVEDNAALRRLAQRVLVRYGYTVLVAQNGSEAQRIAGREPHINAMVIDIIMPGVSGPTVVASIAGDRPDLGVVYMSGYAGGTLDDELSGQRRLFLPKPFTAVQLGQAVRTVLGRPMRKDA